ncbi:YceI family protein [Flavobacterium soyangense]|uniref:YceI family protein n=1 Tax=Flavobacterium soyangense TaxID=2023265 RepID=A0A930U8V9_9FLAO|nr:YceI family protein [Flavobacterium soyangense]MBF2707034.1 YceI family protein [Flavobacterium soyangense]
MTATKWTIDSEQSDVLIKTRHSIIAYLVSKTNTFNGSISVVDDELQDACVEFLFDINAKEGKLEQFDSNLKLNDFIDTKQNPTVSFKSTSFQKVNSDINFLKGNLTINNITKVVELDVMLTGLETHDGNSKAIFEILGNINRKDFGLSYNAYNLNSGIVLGQDMNLTVNLEFTTNSSLN